MTMKKNVLLTSMAIVFATCGFSQVKKSSNEGGFILKGGVNIANVSVTEDGRIDEAHALTSFHVGGVVDVPLFSGLSIQPGLLLTGKGSKTQSGKTTDNSYYKATSNPLYLELPVNFVAKIP